MTTYEQIQGWLDFEDFYDRMVAEAPAPALFIEVGCWMGKSTAYLAQRIIAAGKEIRLHVYDIFTGSPNEPNMLELASKVDVLDAFLMNMKRCGFYFDQAPFPVPDHQFRFSVQRMDSVAAANLYPDGAADFVFIDACHTFEAVQADIAAWRPKVKPGGILAGHDFNTYESVRQAVQAALPGHQVQGNCWWVKV